MRLSVSVSNFFSFSLLWHAPNHEKYGKSYRKRSTGSLSDDFRQVVRWDPIWLLKTCHFAPLDGPIDEKSASTGHSKWLSIFHSIFYSLRGSSGVQFGSPTALPKRPREVQDALRSSPGGTQEARQRVL